MQLLPNSGYIICQGLPSDLVSAMSYDTEKLRKWGLPFNRLDHEECLMWFRLGDSQKSQRCERCSYLTYYLTRKIKQQSLITTEQKEARVLASSHFPMKYLSPASLKQRKAHIINEKRFLKKKVHLQCCVVNNLYYMYMYFTLGSKVY